MTDLIAIANDHLTAQIHPFGAELWSLVDADGGEYMTDADPAFWTAHAPLLFPIVGALVDDTLRVDATAYTLPKHGFARRNPFTVVEHAADRVVLRLVDDARTREVYPFAFQLDMAFAVEGMTLRMTATVHNPGDVPLPFSFGYHPAFAWPLPGGADKAAHRIVFEQDEPQAIRQIEKSTGLLLPGGAPTPVKGREMPLDAELFRADALIWTDLASRSLSYGADGGAWLDIAFPDSPMLGIWQVPGARYVCIEPWQGHADLVGYAGAFRDKPGVVILPQGASRSFRMDVAVRPA
ncbi:MAG: aldose 1-epimerase family protein [Sphingomonadales bacterium]|nr:aldose 1-epimerase family protein [Sphingomonadales bacterium]